MCACNDNIAIINCNKGNTINTIIAILTLPPSLKKFGPPNLKSQTRTRGNNEVQNYQAGNKGATLPNALEKERKEGAVTLLLA